jgi:hypothetical protein
VAFLPSLLPSALQIRVSFGLLNNQPPLKSHGEVRDSLQLSSSDVQRWWHTVPSGHDVRTSGVRVHVCRDVLSFLHTLTTGVFPAILPPQLHPKWQRRSSAATSITSEADYPVSEQFSFYRARLLAPRPTLNLEDQGIPLRLAPTPWPVRHGWPYQ